MAVWWFRGFDACWLGGLVVRWLGGLAVGLSTSHRQHCVRLDVYRQYLAATCFAKASNGSSS